MVAITDEDQREIVLEYFLTVIFRRDCACYAYLIERRDVLIKEIIALSATSDLRPVDIFVRYQNRLHHNHSKILAE
jgi:hypothetical protein